MLIHLKPGEACLFITPIMEGGISWPAPINMQQPQTVTTLKQATYAPGQSLSIQADK